MDRKVPYAGQVQTNDTTFSNFIDGGGSLSADVTRQFDNIVRGINSMVFPLRDSSQCSKSDVILTEFVF